MSDIRQAREALVRRILEGPGKTSAAVRRAAFDNNGADAAGALANKVALDAHRVSEEDILAAKASGLSEDQVFEIAVCAAVGQTSRQYDAALSALDAAIGTTTWKE